MADAIQLPAESDPQHLHAPHEGNPDPLDADSFESDSALGDDVSTTYTESLRSSILESVEENGRGYHKYQDGLYFIPEDDQEQERLDLQHEIFLKTMHRQLYHAPLDCTDDFNALDIGTGTGIWAMDFADEFPQANVIGTDLSAIQPPYVPPNCKFEVDDFDQEWTFPQKFDYIHGRMLAGSLGNPTALFSRVYDSLKPGGWYELQDFAFPVRADDGTMDGTHFERLNKYLCDALKALKRDGSWAERYKEFMIEAGFQNVTEIVYKWPQNRWPKDKELKQLGEWNMINTLDGLHGFSARLCTQVLGMSPEELELLLMGCRKEIQNPRIHAYWPIYVVYGQKPITGT
ncbi:putative methyltransferase [Pseudovirgaria hyperparasitica]|uniref:Putative methyltransferase n=1 Tax=Pseudovirgaria hyperparasitica TaxID=470096 RepID=A0A6A6WAU7_9PEZI|nr:putative methyltransferase [Pseudovirgaria hyperparasitica]KAF2758956.1 putative methyltransferase [Pseudovirgaria hyperparasitica]